MCHWYKTTQFQKDVAEWNGIGLLPMTSKSHSSLEATTLINSWSDYNLKNYLSI